MAADSALRQLALSDQRRAKESAKDLKRPFRFLNELNTWLCLLSEQRLWTVTWQYNSTLAKIANLTQNNTFEALQQCTSRMSSKQSEWTHELPLDIIQQICRDNNANSAEKSVAEEPNLQRRARRAAIALVSAIHAAHYFGYAREFVESTKSWLSREDFRQPCFGDFLDILHLHPTVERGGTSRDIEDFCNSVLKHHSKFRVKQKRSKRGVLFKIFAHAIKLGLGRSGTFQIF